MHIAFQIFKTCSDFVSNSNLLRPTPKIILHGR